jgi:Ser/Thr protein kinase RdoA (MazF antagonist)
MAVDAVEGETCDSDEVDPETAAKWGSLLANLHERACSIALGPSDVTPVVEVGPEMSRARAVYGVLHGDPEIDNVVWASEGPVFVDLDDVRHGWFAADVAFALRDWAPPARGPDLTHPVPRAFLEGYRGVREFSDVELSWLPAFARQSAAETLSRLGPVLSETPDSGWPEWARALHDRVARTAVGLRAALA